ncbi:MAG: hypothetical protein JKY82_02715 [Rhizobiaceae bacterium]|nr:hypothetical protein [Rhizobiaceae bacterium]
MDRINGADTTNIGGGNRGFKDENVVGGIIGTEVTAAHLNAMQEEVLKVVEAAGLVADGDDWTQLWQAIQWMISQNQAGALALFKNSLVFPEIETADAKLAIGDNNDGTLFIGGAQTWLLRGVFRFSSDDTNLADRTVTTVANKTYHVRWHAPGTGAAAPIETYPYGRFELVDMTAAAPPEGDSSYDTTYDNMLVARIVTDGANASTITTFINRASLSFSANLAKAPSYLGSSAWRADFSADLNWSRSPKVWSFSGAVYCNAPGSGNYVLGGANIPNGIAIWRYGWGVSFTTDWLNTSSTALNAYCIAGLKGE